jgi:hypothetical protein
MTYEPTDQQRISNSKQKNEKIAALTARGRKKRKPEMEEVRSTQNNEKKK